MNSPTGELLDLHDEANAEPERTGFTGALELYDEMINFLGLSPKTPPQAAGQTETTAEITRPEPVAPPSEELREAKAAADSGALANSEDVIRITGTLTGFAPKAAGAAKPVCGDCGNQSDGGEMFCIHCGGLLDETATPPAAGLCDDCGATVESDEIFCPSCGSVMASA